MTLTEVSEKYGIAESTLKAQFPRAQKSILKKYGVQIMKLGRGADATYEEVDLRETDLRAFSLFDEPSSEFYIKEDSLKLGIDDFLVFCAIAAIPNCVFRGSFEDFLGYVQTGATRENIDKLKGALVNLEESDLIMYQLDRTDKNYFIASILRKAELDYAVEIESIRICKSIAEKENKRSWIPLMKTYLGVQQLQLNQPFTMEQLGELTNQSPYQIRESKRLLEKHNAIKATPAYQTVEDDTYNKMKGKGYSKIRVGTNVDINAFNDD